MQKLQHTSAVTTRPPRSSSGNFGYARDADPINGISGTVVTADWINDLIDEVNNLIATPTGGNMVPGNSGTQVRDSVLAMIARAAQIIDVFVPSSASNSTPKISSVSSSWTADSVNLSANYRYTSPIVSVAVGTPPPGGKRVVIRGYWSSNPGGNLLLRFFVRKNSSEPWVQKLSVDPAGQSYFEAEAHFSIPVVFDSAANTFDYYFDISRDPGASPVSAGTGIIELWNDGWYAEKKVIMGA
jgi:hypothetical protein